MKQGEWITARDAAGVIGCTRFQVPRLARAGLIGVRRFEGSKIPPRYARADCERLARESVTPARAGAAS